MTEKFQQVENPASPLSDSTSNLAGQPLVSVMIICFNQENFIQEAVESALEQDYENLEVIVADDASTDGTRHILSELGRSHPDRLKIIFNQQNVGITANSNIGLRHCAGDLIAFMGGDDVLLPGKVAQQVAWFAQDEGRVLCGHDVEWIGAAGGPLGIRTSDLVPLHGGCGAAGFIRHGTPYTAASVMVRHASIPHYGFHPALPIVSDWKLWIDVIGRGGYYGYIPGIWARYRRHDGNVTAKLNWPVARDVLMTAVLSLWQFNGRYLKDWLHYFIVRPLAKRLRRRALG